MDYVGHLLPTLIKNIYLSLKICYPVIDTTWSTSMDDTDLDSRLEPIKSMLVG